MRNIRAIVILLSFALLFASNAFADLPTSPPGSGLGLGCTICPIPGPPDPKEPEKPVQVHPTKPDLVSLWYFMVYPQNPGKHGPFTSRTDCETARLWVYNADICFMERRYRYIK